MAGAGMQRLCGVYLRNSGLIGAVYGLVPVCLWFAGTFALLRFREVYVLRLLIALVAAGLLGPALNRFGMELWLAKHRSAQGPASVCDGFLIGAAVGFGINFIPPLTALIASNHPEEAKAFVILAWLGATLVGGAIGALLAAVGRRCITTGSR